MPDLYQTLGVSKSATAEELKSAYRKLAKKLHPDVNPGRKDIEQKFKEVTAAYDLLSDSTKRARYDRGEIDAMGNERAYSYNSDPFSSGMSGNRSRRYSYSSEDTGNPFGGFGADDIFAEFFGGRKGGGQRKNYGPQRGEDILYTLNIPFVQASLGGKQRITLNNNKTIDVNIPPGTAEGHKLRLRGQGQTGNGEAGDAVIEIHVEPHQWFTRKDQDIHLEAPISLLEAVSGTNIRVPTLDGHVSVKVPKGSNTGTTLRLKGKGVPRAKGEAGDMFVKLKIMLPDPMPNDFGDNLEKWAKKHPYDPRKKLGWA